MFQTQSGSVKSNPLASLQIALKFIDGSIVRDIGGQFVNVSNDNLMSNQTLVGKSATQRSCSIAYNSFYQNGEKYNVSIEPLGTITSLVGNEGKFRNSTRTNTVWNGDRASYDNSTANNGQGDDPVVTVQAATSINFGYDGVSMFSFIDGNKGGGNEIFEDIVLLVLMLQLIFATGLAAGLFNRKPKL